MATTYLTYTPSSTGSTTTATLSVWAKRANIGAEGFVFYAYSDNNNRTRLNFQPADTLYMNNIHASSNDGDLTTKAVYRDCHAWYHIVAAWDTTQATASSRFKLWVNGVQQEFTGSTYPTQNQNMRFNESGSTMYIGNQISSNYFAGIYSHFHWIDGTAYQASDFGSTDTDTGEWKINTSPSVTYGTNGSFILKDSNSVTDQSGQGNNWAVAGGTLTSTQDNPSDNFCTLSPLGVEKWTLSNGNLEISGASDNQMMIGSMHSDAGYYECKIAAPNGGTGKGIRLGLVKADGGHALTYSGISGNSGDLERFIGIQNTAGGYKAVYNNGYTVTDFGGTSNANDVMQVAWKGGKVWYGVNGTWFGSGDPSAGTNHVDTLTTGMTYLPAVISSLDGADGAKLNFGNGYFGTTAISSEGTNASGIGKFEYDVPTGCTAVSTKGLNE